MASLRRRALGRRSRTRLVILKAAGIAGLLLLTSSFSSAASDQVIVKIVARLNGQ
jgi:hypothetical protein